MDKNIPLYYNEDKTKFAVLVSYDFGAGWSTWCAHCLAYDKRIVEFWLVHKDDEKWMKECEIYGSLSRPESDAHKEAREFFTNVIGLERCPYMGGFNDIELEWVPVGCRFRINEYDGAESLELESEDIWW